MNRLISITKTPSFYVVSVTNYNGDGVANFSGYTLAKTLTAAYNYIN